VYTADGQLVGYVERGTPREPDLWFDYRMKKLGLCFEPEHAIILGPDRKGGYVFSEAGIPQFFAWPKPGTRRRIYVVPRTAGRGGFTMRWISRTRRDLYLGRRLVGYTHGPDGAPAGLAFFVEHFCQTS
jgi:hypothetical protein